MSDSVAKDPTPRIPACKPILCQGDRETTPYRQARRLSRCYLVIPLALMAFLPGCWKDPDEELLHQALAVGGVVCPDPSWSLGVVHPEEQGHLSHTFTLRN